MNDPKITAKQKILGAFRSRPAGAGEIVSQQAIAEELLPSLSPAERGALDEVLQQLAADGLVEPAGQGGGWRPAARIRCSTSTPDGGRRLRSGAGP